MKLKATTISLIALFSFHFAWTQTEVDSNRIIRVLSFNILHGATTQGDFDLERIAQVIINAKPDLVALQEVDFKTNRAKKFDLATELGWRTRMAPLFGRAMPYDGGEYGEGILSRYSFLTSRNVDLPHSSHHEPRAALEVVVKINSQDTIAFIGTHLDHTRDETDRVAQVTEINNTFSNNRYPTILAGDLNAVPGSTPINILEKMWTASYDKKNVAYTYPSDDPKKKIDYVMYFPANRWKVLNTKVIQDTIASDHCAYLVVLELVNE